MKLEQLMRQHAKTINALSSDNLTSFGKNKSNFEVNHTQRRKSNKFKTVISAFLITLSLCLVGIMPLNTNNASSATDSFYGDGKVYNVYFENERMTYETKDQWMQNKDQWKQDDFNPNFVVPDDAEYMKMIYSPTICAEDFLMLDYQVFNVKQVSKYYFFTAKLFTNEQNFEAYTNFSKIKAIKTSKNYISPKGISITFVQLHNEAEGKNFAFIFFNYDSIFYQINLETSNDDCLNYIIQIYNL